MGDIKVVTTAQLLELDKASIDEGYLHQIPFKVLAQLDAQQPHVLHAHSFYNPPNLPFIRARSMVSALGSQEGAGPFLLDVSRFHWELLQDSALARS